MAYPYNVDYEAAAKEKAYKEPVLKTDRQMWKLMLLNICTCGIYSILFFLPFSTDIDKVSPRRDGEKTFNFIFAFVLSIFFGGLPCAIWYYHITGRIEQALSERGIAYEFSTGDWWGWYFFGSLILVGQFVFFHKMCTAMNLLCKDFNKEQEQKQKEKQSKK